MWLGPLSTPIAPPVAARRSTNAPSVERRPDRRVAADRRGDRARALAFVASGLRQGDRPALVGEAAAELDPARLRPELVGARACRGSGRRCAAARRARRRARLRGRTTAANRARVPSARGDQLARAVERVAVRLDPDRLRDQPARRRLVARAVGAVGQAVARGRAPGGRSPPTWSGPAGRRSRRSARGAGGRRRRASRARPRPSRAASSSSGATGTRSLRRCRRRAAAAARTPARRPSRSCARG